jgi:hypothetical protein
MLALVELDIPANPMYVGFFRAPAVMADPEDFDQVIVEPGHDLSWKQTQRLCPLTCRRHGVPPVPAQMSRVLAILAASREVVQALARD